MSKPILCIDFDGVIHSYTSGWKGVTTIPDPPVDNTHIWLWRATQWWDVNIYSSRTKEPGGVEAMTEWLRATMPTALSEHVSADEFMAAISFPLQKPAAVLTIDDRAITFEGRWSDLDPQALLNFKPWNKR